MKEMEEDRFRLLLRPLFRALIHGFFVIQPGWLPNCFVRFTGHGIDCVTTVQYCAVFETSYLVTGAGDERAL